ncbi:Acb2/Tad1 domain-containing protein [Aneurinibacillus thermoaerophilus]|nr:hypothetical protein [Aneurinibacillus thermoaerophilus]
MMNPVIENNFKYHAATGDKGERHDKVRALCKELAYEIELLCPQSRERSVAMTKLEEVMMWANAAIARNQ